MASYRQLIKQASQMLLENGKSEQLAKLFMLELTRELDIDLYQEYESPISESLQEQFLGGIHRMLADEPMQYILGHEWFYGHQFDVNPDVLIPRPETEELVANVLAWVDDYRKRKSNLTVIDVGCGSGAIAITLQLEEPSLTVLASDISETALEVAKHNADKLHARIEFMQGSMLSPLVEAGRKVDVIVCNPPYIPANEEIETTVKEFEPNVALFGGNDGLKFYRMVFDDCLHVLSEDGFMAFEIGYDQKQALLEEVARRFPHAKAEVLTDINGKDRMLFVDFYCD